MSRSSQQPVTTTLACVLRLETPNLFVLSYLLCRCASCLGVSMACFLHANKGDGMIQLSFGLIGIDDHPAGHSHRALLNWKNPQDELVPV